MKIAVLAKQVPDTWSSRHLDLQTGMLDREASEAVPDEISERACEAAVQIAESGEDVEIIALTMGPNSTETTIRRLMALGAHRGVVVNDPELTGSDAISTARTLAAAINKLDVDLVIAGNESTDGRAGAVPAMVAELLDRPILPYADDIKITGDVVEGISQASNGSLSLSVPLPAVVSVTEKIAEPRFPNFKDIRGAKKKSLEVWNLADLEVEAGPSLAYQRSVMVSADKRAAREAGPKIEDDGTAAVQIADFLAAQRLI